MWMESLSGTRPAYKGPFSQSCGFSSSHVWMWELDNKESWAQKNWCFWTVLWTGVLEKTLESPLESKEINQSILKEISPEYSLEGLMLKLKLQYFGHLMWRTDTLEKTLRLGRIEGRRRRGQQRMRCLMASLTRWTWVWANSRRRWWTGRPGVLQSTGSQKSLTTQQVNNKACHVKELVVYSEANVHLGIFLKEGKDMFLFCFVCRKRFLSQWGRPISWNPLGNIRFYFMLKIISLIIICSANCSLVCIM